jgi:hypothetical protein
MKLYQSRYNRLDMHSNFRVNILCNICPITTDILWKKVSPNLSLYIIPPTHSIYQKTLYFKTVHSMGPNFAEMIFGREKIFKFVQMNMILLVKELVFRGFCTKRNFLLKFCFSNFVMNVLYIFLYLAFTWQFRFLDWICVICLFTPFTFLSSFFFKEYRQCFSDIGKINCVCLFTRICGWPWQLNRRRKTTA